MGQGTHTKIAQVVANSLGLPYEKVKSHRQIHEGTKYFCKSASSTTDLNAAVPMLRLR